MPVASKRRAPVTTMKEMIMANTVGKAKTTQGCVKQERKVLGYYIQGYWNRVEKPA